MGNDEKLYELEIKRLEALCHLSQVTMASSERYQQIIYGMFYAGFFALWFGIGEDINHNLRAASGLSMLISILVYALWAVFGSYYMTVVYKLAVEQLRTPEDLKREFVVKIGTEIGDKAEVIYKFQPVILFLTTGTALFASGCLLYGFIKITFLI